MANAEINVRSWLADFDDDGFEYWEEQDSTEESWEKPWLLPMTPIEMDASESRDVMESSISEIFETDDLSFESATDYSVDNSNSLPDLVSISNSSSQSN